MIGLCSQAKVKMLLQRCNNVADPQPPMVPWQWAYVMAIKRKQLHGETIIHQVQDYYN